jgi:hypothetical protein
MTCELLCDEASFEEELAADVLDTITVFSGRLYGSSNRKNKKLMEDLEKAVLNVAWQFNTSKIKDTMGQFVPFEIELSLLFLQTLDKPISNFKFNPKKDFELNLK